MRVLRIIPVALALLLAVDAGALEVRVLESARSTREELTALLEDPLRSEWLRARDAEALQRRAFELVAAAGWPWAQCAFDAPAETLYLRPGSSATIGSIAMAAGDSLAFDRFVVGARLRVGQRWDEERWERALESGLRHLGDAGHPYAAASLQSVRADSSAQTGGVRLEIWVSPGPRLRFGELHVTEGARTSEVALRRLARLPEGELFRESALEDMRRRLLQREIIDAVERVELRRAPGASEAVDVYLGLAQPERRGRFSAAVGVIEDRERNDTRISGTVELEFMDLFGSARQFGLSWLDDGRSRRRLDLRYLEPVVFGSPFDAALALGQRHEDGLYESFLADAGVRLPLQSSQTVELGVGIDRTTFEASSVDEARVRTRRRLVVAFQLSRGRSPERVFFGRLRSEFQAAWIRETGGGSSAAAPPSQSLLEFGVSGGWQLRPRVALLTRSHWQSVESDEELLPRSEQLRLGGAATVRGYAEEQFLGSRLGFGGLEVEFGHAEGGRAYLFGDLGWIQTPRPVGAEVEMSEQWLRGFGLGLRSPLAIGAMDLSLAFAEEIRFETGKLHLKLIQEF